MNNRLSAGGLSVAAANDPQFRLPQRPCVVPGVVTGWVDDQLLIEGTGSRRVLSGRSARRILPDLLPLLDGTRTPAQLAGQLEQPEARILPVLLLLFSCGLLQDGPDPRGLERAAQAVLLARSLDTTRVNANAAQAQARLTAARVGLAGDVSFRCTLGARLRAVGLRVQFVEAYQPESSRRSTTEHGPEVADGVVNGLDLLIAWFDAASSDRTAALCRAAREADVPVLMVGPAGDRFFLGPYSAADYGACCDCYLAQTLPTASTASHAALRGFAALTALEVVAHLAGVGTPASLRGRTLLDVRAERSASTYLPPRPSCPVCGTPEVSVAQTPIAYRYETSVAFPPRRLVNPRDHQHHFESSNVELQFDFPHFFPGEVTELDGAHPAADINSGAPDKLTLSAVARLLAGSCGLKQQPVQGGKLLRWAPTGGNLGSPTAYLIARQVAGLPAGVYGYQPSGHRLVLLAPEPRPDLTAGDEVATIVLTGALLRVAKKYRAFAYRVLHLDAGVALCHLALLARQLQVHATNRCAWDDAALGDALGIDRDLEPVTAVVSLTPRPDRGCLSGAAR